MKIASNNSYYKLPILDGLELLNAQRHTQDFPVHTHDTFNITLVIDQLFSTQLSDRLVQASAGNIVITNPGEVHATICDNKLGSSFFTFYVSPDAIKDLNKNSPVTFCNKAIEDKLLFQQLYALSQDCPGGKLQIEEKLVIALKRLVAQHSIEAIVPGDKARLFRAFLKENSLEKFSLEKTAHQFGLDKYKFLRLFKQQTGLTPNNYIILKRIEKSKELLQTQDDLLDIAIQTGFYDATHLCKYFKKITGITPLAYRNAWIH